MIFKSILIENRVYTR